MSYTNAVSTASAAPSREAVNIQLENFSGACLCLVYTSDPRKNINMSMLPLYKTPILSKQNNIHTFWNAFKKRVRHHNHYEPGNLDPMGH